MAVERRWKRDVHDTESLLHGRERDPAIVGWRAVVGSWVGREGGINGGDHVVLILLVGVPIMHAIRVAGLHGSHVCLHGEQRAVGSELRLVGDMHASEVPAAAVVTVDDLAVGQDVCESAFVAELAVALRCSQYMPGESKHISDLCEVLARRSLGQRLVRMQERTGFSSLASALSVELAGHV